MTREEALEAKGRTVRLRTWASPATRWILLHVEEETGVIGAQLGTCKVEHRIQCALSELDEERSEEEKE